MMIHNKVTNKKHLLVSCQAGDREAQGLLYSTYRRKMLKIIRQYVADYDMAQDILHDGFLIILSQIQTLRNPESLDYWMATIMKNLAIHTLSQVEFDKILEETNEEIDADECNGNISYDELMTLINQLPNGYQTVFRLAVLDGKSHKEIADMLGISPKSSASQLARAKEKLRLLVIEYKKKAGLLAILLLAASLTYLHMMNEDTSADMMPKTVDNSKRNQKAQAEEMNDSPVENHKSHLTLTLQKQSIDAIQVVKDSTAITDEVQINDTTSSLTTDHVKHQSDTTKNMAHKKVLEKPFVAEYEAIPTSHPHNEKWGVKISTNALGIGSGNNVNQGNGMMASPDINGGNTGNEDDGTTSINHLMPITIGVRVSKQLSPKWAIETGLQYSLLRTDITRTFDSWSYSKNIKAHFLSIPVDAKYRLLQWEKINLYALGGIRIDIPIGSTIESVMTDERSTLHYPVSFSIDAGAEFEYQMTPTTSLFIMPSLNYHIMEKSDLPILWQDHPLSFDLPIGVRFSW